MFNTKDNPVTPIRLNTPTDFLKNLKKKRKEEKEKKMEKL